MKIPSVKIWIVITDTGKKYEIWAPTRFLAILNFRHEIGYVPIKSVEVKRNQEKDRY